MTVRWRKKRMNGKMKMGTGRGGNNEMEGMEEQERGKIKHVERSRTKERIWG